MIKTKLIDYLASLHPLSAEFIELINSDEIPVIKHKCMHDLIRPPMAGDKAFFLDKGFGIGYIRNDNFGDDQIFYIWLAGEVVLLPSCFYSGAPNEHFYIRLSEDTDLVLITSQQVLKVCQKFMEAPVLMHLISSIKFSRLYKRGYILTQKSRDRLAIFIRLLPEIYYKLSNNQVCAFIDISEKTRSASKAILDENSKSITLRASEN